jgi:hypothetical protein
MRKQVKESKIRELMSTLDGRKKYARYIAKSIKNNLRKIKKNDILMNNAMIEKKILMDTVACEIKILKVHSKICKQDKKR